MATIRFHRKHVRRLAAASTLEQFIRRVRLTRARRRTGTTPADALVTSRGRRRSVRSRLPAPGSRAFDRIARRAARRQLLTFRAEAMSESKSLAVASLMERGVPIWLDVPASASILIDSRLAEATAAPSGSDNDLGRYIRSVRLARAAGTIPSTSVSVLLATRRPSMLVHALTQLQAQRNVTLQLVLGLHGDWSEGIERQVAQSWSGHSTIVRADTTTTLGGLLRAMTEQADGVLVTKWDDDDWYGPNHIADLIRDHVSSGAQLVGKAAEFVWLESVDTTVRRSAAGARTYSSNLAGGTMLLARSDLEQVGGFSDAPRFVDRLLIDAIHRHQGSVYRSHGLEFILRRSATGEHTWKAEDRYFLDESIDRRPGVDLLFADIRIDAPDHQR